MKKTFLGLFSFLGITFAFSKYNTQKPLKRFKIKSPYVLREFQDESRNIVNQTISQYIPIINQKIAEIREGQTFSGEISINKVNGKELIKGEITIPTLNQPVIPTEQPTKLIDQPIKPTEQPVMPTELPTMPTEQPVMPTEKPVMPTELPTMPTEQPTMPTGQLPAEYIPSEGWHENWNIIPKNFWINSKCLPGNDFIFLAINDKYISVNSDGIVKENLKKNDISNLFSVEFIGENMVYLRSYLAGYLTINEDKTLSASSRSKSSESQFSVFQTNGDCELDDPNYILLRSSSGKYLSIINGEVKIEDDVSENALFKGIYWNENNSLC